MNILALLLLLFIVPLLLFMGTRYSLVISWLISDFYAIAFLALSSCLGSGFRGEHGLHDRTYFRTMTSTGPSASEHIELGAMLDDADN
jgi:hypothetical protein